MVVPFDKVLINLSYKAPELKLQYALAELLDYVQEVKLLEAKTLLLQQGNTLHRELEKQYEARIAELEAQSEGMPWEDVQKFQDALRAEYGKVIAEKDARFAELEGKLAEQDVAEEAHLQIIFNQNIRITEAEAEVARLSMRYEKAEVD